VLQRLRTTRTTSFDPASRPKLAAEGEEGFASGGALVGGVVAGFGAKPMILLRP